MIIEEGVTGKLFFVLSSDQFSVFVWPLRVCVVGHKRFAAMDTGPESKYGFVHPMTLDVAPWLVWPYQVSSPLQNFVDLGYNSDISGISFALADTPEDVMSAAAKKGFRGLTQDWLELAAKNLGYPWDKTRAGSCFLARVQELIRAVLPHDSDEAIYKYMQQREPISMNSFLHHKSNLEGVEGCLDDDDRLECRQELEEGVARKVRKQQIKVTIEATMKHLATGSKNGSELVAAPSLGPTGKKQAPGSKRAAEKKYGDFYKYLDDFIPDVKGCRIQPVVEKRCFYALFPREAPAYSHTQTWSASSTTGVQPLQCLRNCVRWCWGAHSEHGWGAMPCDLAQV